MTGNLAAIASFTLLECVRNRTLWVASSILLLTILIAAFVGQLAIIETQQMQSAFIAVFVRLASVVLIALMVISTMVREIHEKHLQLTMAFPISRSVYLLGKFAGFALVTLLVLLLVLVPVWFYAPAGQVLIWGVSLYLELLIVVLLALLCVQTFAQMTTAFVAVMGVYLLSRAMHAIQLMGQGVLFDQDSASQGVINQVLAFIAHVLPGLNYFAMTDWLVYHTGTVQHLLPVLIQSGVYLGLLGAVTLFDLYRKNL